MKLLSLLQGHRVEDQIGFHESGIRLMREGWLEDYQAIPFLAADRLPPENPTYDLILESARKIGPDFIFFQHFHFYKIPDPTRLIAQLRSAVPQAVILVSSGDSFGRWTRRLPESLVQASRAADLTFLSGMGYAADELKKKGGRNIALMPHGFCPVRFPEKTSLSPKPTVDWEVVCVASNYRVRNPFSYLYQRKLARIGQIRELERRYGGRFALFGKGWEGFSSWRGPLPYEKQGDIFRSSRVVVGGHPGGGMDYYLSDREFIAMASGSPFVEFWTPRIESIFSATKHWHLYRDTREMIKKVDSILKDPADLNQKASQETETYVRSKHSNYHRLKEMLQIATEFGFARSPQKKYQPKLNFFLPKINWEEEKKHALRGWTRS
jgi:hypothetical protein